MNISEAHSWIAIKRCLKDTKTLPRASYPLGNTSQFNKPVPHKITKRIKDVTLAVHSVINFPLDIYHPWINMVKRYPSDVLNDVIFWCEGAYSNKQNGLAAELIIANLKGAQFQISEENQEGYAQWYDSGENRSSTSIILITENRHRPTQQSQRKRGNACDLKKHLIRTAYIDQEGYQKNKGNNRCHRLLVSVLDKKNGKRSENCHDKWNNWNKIPQIIKLHWYFLWNTPFIQ